MIENEPEVIYGDSNAVVLMSNSFGIAAGSKYRYSYSLNNNFAIIFY